MSLWSTIKTFQRNPTEEQKTEPLTMVKQFWGGATILTLLCVITSLTEAMAVCELSLSAHFQRAWQASLRGIYPKVPQCINPWWWHGATQLAMKMGTTVAFGFLAAIKPISYTKNPLYWGFNGEREEKREESNLYRWDSVIITDSMVPFKTIQFFVVSWITCLLRWLL